MTPEEKSELARLNREFDRMGPIDGMRYRYGLNLTTVGKLVLLLQKQVTELEERLRQIAEPDHKYRTGEID